MKRIRMEVCPAGKPGGWKVTESGRIRYIVGHQSFGIKVARALIAELVRAGFLVTLKIKRKDGTVREERTYPRSSDPRRSKG